MCKENPSYYAVIPANVRYDKRLKANEKLLFGEITSLSNKKGYCWASNKYFADLYGVTNQAVSKWIKDLKDIGYIEIDYIYKDNSKEIEKRIIKLIGINKNEQVLINDDDVLINDDTGINKYLQGYKPEFKDNNTRNNNKINNNIYNKEFDELWKLYPRKQGKAKALQSYIKARKNGVDFDTIKKGVENYFRYVENNRIEQEYIKHGSTWFNQECWNDEYGGVKYSQGENYQFAGGNSKSTWGCSGEVGYDIEELMKIK